LLSTDFVLDDDYGIYVAQVTFVAAGMNEISAAFYYAGRCMKRISLSIALPFVTSIFFSLCPGKR